LLCVRCACVRAPPVDGMAWHGAQTEKRIVHPGELNSLRLCHQNPSIVCTHSDTSTVYVWDTDAAPHVPQNKRCVCRRRLRCRCRCWRRRRLPLSRRGAPTTSSRSPLAAVLARRKVGSGASASPHADPVLTLVGHEEMAQYALDCSRQAPLVASGGQDHLVLMWSLEDADQATASASSSNGGGAATPHTVCLSLVFLPWEGRKGRGRENGYLCGRVHACSAHVLGRWPLGVSPSSSSASSSAVAALRSEWAVAPARARAAGWLRALPLGQVRGPPGDGGSSGVPSHAGSYLPTCNLRR
jgi:hypothetical protein